MTDNSIPQDDPLSTDALDKSYWLWTYNGSDSEDYDNFEGPFDSIEEAESAFTHGYYPYIGQVFNNGKEVSVFRYGKWERE